MPHPCLSCGACCATWPVQFDRMEVTRALRAYVVPAATRKHVILAGTEKDTPRCVGLEGEIGACTRCTLYVDRPSPCHEVKPSLEDGHRDLTCDEARARHGLPRLYFKDWR